MEAPKTSWKTIGPIGAIVLVVGVVLGVRHCRAAARREKCEKAAQNLLRISVRASALTRSVPTGQDIVDSICDQDPPEGVVSCWTKAATSRQLDDCSPDNPLKQILHLGDDGDAPPSPE